MGGLWLAWQAGADGEEEGGGIEDAKVGEMGAEETGFWRSAGGEVEEVSVASDEEIGGAGGGEVEVGLVFWIARESECGGDVLDEGGEVAEGGEDVGDEFAGERGEAGADGGAAQDGGDLMEDGGAEVKLDE